jgi:transketolase
MHYDPKKPEGLSNDRLVLSKGHAAPILYAAWHKAGWFTRE